MSKSENQVPPNEEELKNIASQLRKPQGEQAVGVGEFMNKGNRLINELSLKKLNPQDGDRILEIGMGNGFFVKSILTAGKDIRYAGCDYSAEMVREASSLNKEALEEGLATFLLGNADELPYDDHQFHKALSVNTLYFWENPAKVLEEIKRVIIPNGKLVLSIRPKEVMSQYPFTKYGFTMYSREELADLLSQNGFSPLEIHHEKEPDQEINGVLYSVETLVAVARPER